jgi:hypothetical protein
LVSPAFGLFFKATDIPTSGRGQAVTLDKVADNDGGRSDIGVNLARFRKVCNASMRTHEDVGRVEAALNKSSLGF